MVISFECYEGLSVPQSLLQQCSALFGTHYGTWGTGGAKPGHPVRQSPESIKELLASSSARLAVAKKGGQIIAYAAAVQPTVPDNGKISWVTQLVVHSDHRNQRVATRLLYAFWQFSDHFAWGLVTANPFAIRALEKATRRRANPSQISSNIEVLLQAGREVPYIKSDIEVKCDDGSSLINTNFFVDHQNVPMLVQQASSDESWLLGELPDGWEWFAFTFSDQAQLPLAPVELQEMLKVSDEQTAVAYARMTQDNNHLWRSFSDYEAEFIWKNCNLYVDSRVLDLGCGDGRHIFSLARKGASAVGIDYVESRIESAKQAAVEHQVSADFKLGDARTESFDEKFDCVLCLYDVVGSHANNVHNIQIVQNSAKHVAPGGFVLISVMNFELTEHIAKHSFSVTQQPDRLLSLRPGNYMESSGNVFHPDYFMIDPEEQLVYRKEQFVLGGTLPVEMLVRDRRFRAKELEDICKDSGLEILWSRFVKLGNWEASLDARDEKAKEILVLCQKPLD